jgi:hypothetical protein
MRDAMEVYGNADPADVAAKMTYNRERDAINDEYERRVAAHLDTGARSVF